MDERKLSVVELKQEMNRLRFTEKNFKQILSSPFEVNDPA
jgi:hypothetical protein